MAAAEAKPPRKHSGNHFPVQGDGCRTSKLLTTPPFSSKSECDAASNHRVRGFYSPTKAAHVPTFYQTVGIKLETDEQPNVQHHKDFAVGWAKALQAEVDVSSIQIANKTTVSGKEHRNIEEFDYRVCKNYVATEVMSNNKSVNTTKKIDSMDEFHYIEDDFTDLHNFDSQVSKQGEKVSDLESHWTGTEKTKPWWQSASKDELASFVARKSLANLENCDLPQPRTKHQRKDQSTCLECFEQDCFLTSSFTETQLSGLDEYNRGMHPSVGMGERRSIVSKVGRPRHHHSHFSRTSNEENNPRSISNLNVGKAQLLEALCHSQTRAREAEKAAQEADTEKKHIVSLFLRQATQLFAYKQWFQLMQLENICLQLRSKEHPVTGLFSDVLPWVPCKDRQFYQPRDKRKKRGRYSRKFTMYEIAFALGLGLAGAGLLLGWTTGWLVPIF